MGSHTNPPISAILSPKLKAANMKKSTALPLGAGLRRLLLFLAFSPVTLILGQSGTAKNTKKNPPAATTTTTTKPANPPTVKAPIAKNMKDYAKTPPGLKRAQKFAKTFAPATNGAATKTIPYPDGSALHLTMVRNPDFADMPTTITAKVKSDKNQKPQVSKDAAGNPWDCTTDHIQLTATSTTFLNNDYSAQASHIYPGACYTFNDFYDGSYKEMTGTRYPLTILTDNPNIKGSPYRVVTSPNMATIRAALDDLFHEATSSTATESLSYQVYTTSNDADESLKISGGASGYGVTLSAGYSTSNSTTTMSMTIDAIKTLFTINTVPPDSGFFVNPTTEATPYAMVIGSVSYGIRVLANVNLSFSSQQEAANFAAKYSGFGVSANIGLDQLSKESSVSSTINCYVVGGPSTSTTTFNKKDLEKGISSLLAGATYKNAMPIKYDFYDMAGDVVGSNSATDDFAVRECTPGKDDPRLQSVFVNFQTGNDDKNQDDDYILYLYPGGVNQQQNPSGPATFGFGNLFSLSDSWMNYIAGGSVFAYGSGPNSPDYPNNSSITVQMYPQNRASTLSEFTAKGGAFRLHLEPHNTDTWNISSITVTLNFAGPTAAPQKITFPGYPNGFPQMSNSNTDLLLYFGPDFKPR
jgi:hypothetical protein